MPTLEDSITIAQTKDVLFDLSQDYSLRLQWDKYLRKAELIDSQTPQVNGLVYCESQKGIGMTARYISFNRPVQTAMEMTEGPFIFRKFSGSWRFIELQPRLTKVVFRYNFQTKLPLFLDPLVNWLLKADLAIRLKSLKQYAELKSTT